MSEEAPPYPASDPRCESGVDGLDDILSGGLPRDCFYLIQGGSPVFDGGKDQMMKAI